MLNTPLPVVLADLEAPRMPTLNMRHDFEAILVLGLCGILGGAEDWPAVEAFCVEHEAWFRTFLKLPHDIPSHQAFSRVFRRIDSQAFELGFIRWTSGVIADLNGVVSIDGKTVRGSRDVPQDRKAIHMVSA